MVIRGKGKNVPESGEIGNDANYVVVVETIKIIFQEIFKQRQSVLSIGVINPYQYPQT